MRKASPCPKRRHSILTAPTTTRSLVAIFLKEFGLSRLLKKTNIPQYYKK